MSATAEAVFLLAVGGLLWVLALGVFAARRTLRRGRDRGYAAALAAEFRVDEPAARADAEPRLMTDEQIDAELAELLGRSP
jgi:hypothetical protein